VSDEGPGFDQETAAHAFDPFFTKKQDGTGLGLAIVKRFVDLHGGNVVITPATAAEFNTWYQANDAISVAGKDLTEWSQWAAANNMLPSGVCGILASAATLQEQVFGKDPAVGDPWGA